MPVIDTLLYLWGNGPIGQERRTTMRSLLQRGFGVAVFAAAAFGSVSFQPNALPPTAWAPYQAGSSTRNLGMELTISSASAQGRDLIFIRDTEIENTIRFYMKRIYEAAAVDPSGVNIHLIRDSRLNAFVAGGQRIFINTGLLVRAETPEQVIGVLAHELGHITGGHLSQFRDNLENARAASIAGFLLGLGGALATGNPDAFVAGQSLGSQIGTRNFLSYTRANEQAADQAAVDFLDRANISSRGLLEFMQVLARQNRLYSAGTNPYTQTHPLTEDRVRFMENHVANSPIADLGLPQDYLFVHDRMRAKLVAYLTPEDTLDRLPPSDTTPPARYARAIAYMETFQIDKAHAEIDSLIADNPTDPFYIETKADIFRSAGQMEQAADYFRQAVELLPWAALIRTALANTLLDTNNPDVVEEALDNAIIALSYEPNMTRAWNARGRAHSALGQTGMVALAQAEVAIRRGQREAARSNAERAMDILPEGSSGWVQAQDIVFRLDN